ncbi:uncharacterized protein LOC121992711 [Zingiber officinale]|uniref:uncharacterized protein LOC121992711 n=1 Tax=Zingiber officinale TaxID=94328 RepID=UPI001C4A7DFA|nr:uncharacterized protein LOC121992711 [Zingiber officinale]XP_042403176.1 uncharacterized protein LOC121992711 [Zingiber officinale]
MTCKSHPVVSGAGVCATCLRERLNSVAADTEHLEEPDPIPCSAPSSASAGLARLSLLWAFFGRLDHNHGRRGDGGEGKTHKFRNSTSWLSSLLNRRRRKKKLPGPVSADSAAAVVSSRGMTPEDHSTRFPNPPMSHMMRAVAGSDLVISPESGRPDDDSPRPLPSHTKRTKSESYRGMSPRRGSESSAPPWLMKPLPARRSATDRPGGELAGFALCFRPLVTASPARQNFQIAGVGFSGATIRVSPLGPLQRRRASTGGGMPRHYGAIEFE